MIYLFRSLTAALMVGMLAAGTPAVAQIDTFFEADGLIVIEAEATQSVTSWQLLQSLGDYTGTGYLSYTGANRFNQPGTSVLNYRLAISTPGVYRIQWRSRIAQGNDNTEHNDSWLRLPDANDFYATRTGSIVYPKGSGKMPNPDGGGKDGWFKVYQNTLGRWAWRTATSDNDPHNIFVRFDTAKVYLMQVSGRSEGHAIDRIVLHRDSIPAVVAQDTALPASRTTARMTSATSFPRTQRADSVFPNPARSSVTITSRYLNEANALHATAIDVAGRRYALEILKHSADSLGLNVQHLPPGVYTVLVDTGRTYISTDLFIAQP